MNGQLAIFYSRRGTAACPVFIIRLISKHAADFYTSSHVIGELAAGIERLEQGKRKTELRDWLQRAVRLKLSVFLLLPLLSGAAEIPEPVLPAGVGVNIHFVTGHHQDLDLIAAAGFKFVRMDFGWESTERKKGQYEWAEYDELLTNLEVRGLRALFILDYSHHVYEETVSSPHPFTHLPHKSTASPQHPDSIAAYARWAAAAAKHYQGRHVLWEIWNEPNIQFWSPKPDAQQYAALALAAAKAIRQADAQATVIGPASSGFPLEFLEIFLKSGVLEILDGVSVHPYRNPHTPPETATADFQRLRKMIDQYAPAARQKKIPILSGEWGYSSHSKGVSLPTQAAFAVRQQLSNLLNEVPLSIWYDWKNDGDDPNENEHNFGTVMANLAPKPAYNAIKTLTGELGGFRLKRRLPLPNDQDYALVFIKPSAEQKVAAWTSGDPHPIRLELSAKHQNQFSGVSGQGEKLAIRAEGGQLMLELKPLPQYISIRSAALK